MGLFDKAEFGDIFVTADGRIAVYLERQDNPTGDGKYTVWHFVRIDGTSVENIYTDDGKEVGCRGTDIIDDDIVGAYMGKVITEELLLDNGFELSGSFNNIKHYCKNIPGHCTVKISRDFDGTTNTVGREWTVVFDDKDSVSIGGGDIQTTRHLKLFCKLFDLDYAKIIYSSTISDLERVRLKP